jgi:hypothetical protein
MQECQTRKNPVLQKWVQAILDSSQRGPDEGTLIRTLLCEGYWLKAALFLFQLQAA